MLDEELPEEHRANILEAIEEWNTKTVITLKPREDDPDFVRFQLHPGTCASHVGMTGGEQGIYLHRDATRCHFRAIVHEIGHAVGLHHEHQRTDVDERVMQLREYRNPWPLFSSEAYAPPTGPYDFASTMHYLSISRNEVTMDTIPPGIPFGSPALSAGDIDGVAHLYGHPPAATTVSSNPSGLKVLVDGVSVTTPATFQWEPESLHTLESPIAQTRGGSRFLFGRWNIDGPRRMRLTTSPETTWIEANFITQHKIAAAAASGEGSVELTPATLEGYCTLRSAVTAEAKPAPGWEFRSWTRAVWYGFGFSSNPASQVVPREELDFRAYFTNLPLFRIHSDAAPVRVQVDGHSYVAPMAWVPPKPGGTVSVEVPELQYVAAGAPRYRFAGWSDGGAADVLTREFTPPENGGSIGLLFAPEYDVSARAERPDQGSVTLDPPLEDGYYPAGTVVQVSAAPNPGWRFWRWKGYVEADLQAEASVAVAADDGKELLAVFTQTQALVPGEPREVDFPSAPKYASRVYSQESGFHLVLPPAASQVRIELESESTADVRLLAHTTSWVPFRDSETGAFGVEHQSSSADPRVLTITAADDPPLDPDGLYYVSVASLTPAIAIEGTLRATATLADPRPRPRIKPRALSLVSGSRASAEQTVTLENRGSASLRYRFSPSKSWLSATPGNGVLAPGTEETVTVSASPALLASGVHRAEMELLPDGPEAAGFEHRSIHVTFVVVPSSAR